MVYHWRAARAIRFDGHVALCRNLRHRLHCSVGMDSQSCPRHISCLGLVHQANEKKMKSSKNDPVTFLYISLFFGVIVWALLNLIFKVVVG